MRVSGLMQQVAAGHSKPTPDGLSASQKLDRIRGRVLQLQAQHSDLWETISERAGAKRASACCRWRTAQQRQNELRQRFMDEIFPVLTPLAVDPSHPFPYISDLSLSLAVTVRDPASGDRRFARVKVPPVLPRMWEVAPRTYVLLERVIAANLDALFPGMEVESHHLFRVTRNADLDIEEDEADDLLMAMEEELRRRRFGKVVRLEVERSMPHATRALLQRGLSLEPANIYEIRGMLDLRGLDSIADLDIPELQPAAVDAGGPAAPDPSRGGGGRRRGHLRPHPRGRHPGAPPLRVVHPLGAAAHRPGGRRPRRPDHQDDALPHQRRFAHRALAHPRGGERQAGRGDGGDQGPLRRARQHRLGTSPGARRRPRGLRAAGPQDALQVHAHHPPRVGRPAPLRPHRDRQLQPQDGPHLHRHGPAHRRPRAHRAT